MKNIITFLFLSALLTGCDYLASYATKVQQGNIIETHEVAQIRKGMTKEQVENIMGSPVLENTFDNNRWLYVYTFKKARRPVVRNQFIVVFHQNRVIYTEDGRAEVRK